MREKFFENISLELIEIIESLSFDLGASNKRFANSSGSSVTKAESLCFNPVPIKPILVLKTGIPRLIASRTLTLIPAPETIGAIERSVSSNISSKFSTNPKTETEG